MPFIGNTPDVNFTSFAKQDLTGATGDPAKRGFTLTHAVANANEIEVFVNNVRQEPTEAYGVSATTLTMTGDVETSDDFYIIYLGKALQTTVPPDGSVVLTSKVSGVLPVANGGTGQSTALVTGSMVKLLDVTMTNLSEYIITSTYINPTYNKYKLYFQITPATDGTYLYSYAYVSGSEVGTGNIHSRQLFPMDGGAVATNTSVYELALHNKYAMGNAVGEGITVEADILNVNVDTAPYLIMGHMGEIPTSGLPVGGMFSGSAKPAQRASRLNGLKLKMNNGNIATGNIQLYGVV